MHLWREEGGVWVGWDTSDSPSESRRGGGRMCGPFSLAQGLMEHPKPLPFAELQHRSPESALRPPAITMG